MFAITTTAIYVVSLILLVDVVEKILIQLVMVPALYDTGIILAIASIVVMTLMYGDVIT